MAKKKMWQLIMDKDMNEVAKGLEEYRRVRELNNHKKFAQVAERYYESKHDILDSRIFYLDGSGKVVEDTTASNIQIPHPFFMEQIDQKVQHLLSNGVQFKTENNELEQYLYDYFDDDFNLFMNEIVEGASVKGVEFAYARTTNDDQLKFEVSDYLTTDSIVDNYKNEVAVVRTYIRIVDDEDGKPQDTEYAEVYTADETKYFVYDSKENKYILDVTKEPNPRGHIVALNDDGVILSRSYGRIPFYRLSNNRKEQSDLVPIKALIDDYDRQASFLSNDLQDFGSPIFIVHGAQADSIENIRTNLRSRKMLKTSKAPNDKGGQGVDILSHEIPVEARRTKLDVDREAIYKFGLAFDSSHNDGSNLTNVAIQSRYSLLNLKCNKIEPRVRSLIKWCLELILEDIKRLHGKTFDINDIDIILERNTIVNEKDLADTELIEAQAKQTLINTLVMSAPYIDDDTLLKQICTTLEIDYDEVKKLVLEQASQPFEDESELVDNDQETEQDSE
ncbi:phage portal protein [Globicatella sp. PHS-GS-PNBC-21-1553]|uniref:phage portal protein n=1 Tax=Globicatella sp. PHS-GS-PNBC-21-1553 TaxID=2885764 RepID=UPI00298F19A1|nr:phage portal protein [Globicatella sp. PHS-GS-PNBC-21-1553]WPC08001.1 phage portal protein [Globicatella sp. PHS-GS-PNBC-21-1553]